MVVVVVAVAVAVAVGVVVVVGVAVGVVVMVGVAVGVVVMAAVGVMGRSGDVRDDPNEIARRAAILREAGLKARAEGRLVPTVAELNEALGDELGLDSERRRRAGKTPKLFGIRPRRRDGGTR